MKMRKIVTIVIVLCLGLNNSVFVNANEISNVNEVSSMKEIANTNSEMNDFIQEADKYIIVNDEGLIELNLPDNIIEMIDADEYEMILQGIDNINNEVESGDVIVTDNGTVYDTSDDELVVQGGNVNKVVKHWWGLLDTQIIVARKV